jgi:hypothetical protein
MEEGWVKAQERGLSTWMAGACEIGAKILASTESAQAQKQLEQAGNSVNHQQAELRMSLRPYSTS